MANSVVLILGVGPRIGASVAAKFTSNGYKIAVASRKGSNTKTSEGYLSLKADFAKPDSIPALFDTVKAEFQTFPSVVIYNAAALTGPPNKDSPFSISAESVASDLNVNTISPYVAAQQAVKGWEMLPNEIKKTFIYTGNIMNVTIVPMSLMMDLGMGKSASAFWIGLADMMYSTQGCRFFYADERHEDGKFKGMALDGAAHGEFYAQLANHKGNVPWHATFVKNKGYVQFK
ncbi:NAD(P)-binding protein [Hypoxylon trugodes]|uniref:NAD(P)-binding protein n=1 Tax=Hypoxylon trugodes TaxID=326681 RepID=UPI0021942712|nr:NAD(P)-binding protein [Hypoxylon trugodes]KAI1387683.1 NAD(P)-binding protein [Hypoxylon trugodes]